MSKKRRYKVEPPTEFDEKIGKKALVFLKKQAIAHARTGQGRSLYNTGTLLRAVEAGPFFDDRTKMYRGMIRFLNYCVELGIVGEGKWDRPKQFCYVGHEVEAAEREFSKRKSERKKSLIRDLRRLGIRQPSISDSYNRKGSFYVNLSDDQVARIAAKL